MVRITTVINQKGGVGKTTTAHALATGLYYKGYKVLVIDVDQQGNLTYIFKANPTHGVYESMKGKNVKDLIIHTETVDILPSSSALVGADLEFTQTGREYLLKDAIEPILSEYSHIIIDSPPTLGIMTINALTACNDVIIPMGADIFSLQALGQLYDTIKRVKKYCNNSLKIAGLLITRYSSRTLLSKDLTDVIEGRAEQIKAPIYKTRIREGIAIKEAQTMQTSIYDSHKKAKVTKDYKELINEYLKQEE